MKKIRTLLVLAGLVVLVASISAFAQATWNGSNLLVKFSAHTPFYAGDKLMPAGEYEVRQGAGAQANMLLLTGKGKNETYLEFTPVGSPKPLTKMAVSFNRYGDKEFLSAIEWPGGDSTQGSWVLKINPSAAEQDAAKATAAVKHSVSATKK